MSDDAALLIPIQFSLEEARAALAQLEAQARAAGKASGEGFGGEAKKGLGGFLETLQAFKSEQVQQGRQARFFAGEILSILPASDSARGGMEQLLGMFIEGAAGGIGFGLALEGVKLAVSTVTEELKRNEFQLGAVSRAQTQANLLWAQGREDLNSLTTSLTEGQKAQRVEAEKLLPKLQAIDEEYRNLREEGPGWVAKMELAFAQGSPGMKQWQAQLDLLNDKYRKAAQGVKLFAVAAGDLAGGYEQSAAQEKAYWDLRAADEKAAQEARKAAQEARKALVAEFAGDITAGKEEYAAKAQALMLAAQEAGLDERAKVELEHQRTMAGLREGDVASQVAAMVIRDAKLDALDKQHYEADYQRFYESLDKKARAFEKAVEERLRKEAEVKAAILSIGQELARDALEGLMGSLIHANLANSRYTAQYNALASAQRAQMLLQRGAAKSLAEAQTMVASEAAAAKAAEAAATKASEAEKLKAMAIGWALQAAVAAVPFGPSFNPAVAAVYGAAAVAAGVAAGSLASAATHQAQGRGLTAQENDSLAGMKGTAVSSGGSRGYGAGSSSGGGTVTIRETVFVIGDAFESPAETARRAARVMALAERLDMGRRAS